MTEENQARSKALSKLKSYGITPHAKLEPVAELLDRWVGIHHIEPGDLLCGDWTQDWGVYIRHYGEMATFDGDELTRLVLLALDLRVRVAISPRANRYVTLYLAPADNNTLFCGRQRTLEETVAWWRGADPL